MRRIGGDTLVTLMLLAAFAGATLWLLRRTAQPDEPTYPPLTTLSPQPSGAMALYELAEATGLAPRRYHDSEYHYPEGACVVLASGGGIQLADLAQHMLDARAVRLWLEEGGTLLLAAAPGDGPVDALREELYGEDSATNAQAPEQPLAVAAGSGAGTKGKISPADRTGQSGEQFRLGDPRPPLWREVHKIETGDAAAADLPGSAVLLATEQPGADPLPLLLEARVGQGRLLWLTRPELLSNAWLARADNHRFALSLLRYGSDGRALWFDEHAHGYAAQTPSVLALLLHTTGGRLLLATAALCVLLFAGAAVRPARFSVEAVPARRQSAEMVLGQADLFRRAEARHVIADSLLDGLRRSAARAWHRSSLPTDAELLELAQLTQGLSAAQRHALCDYLEQRLLPRSAHGLMELAHGCDALHKSLLKPVR